MQTPSRGVLGVAVCVLLALDTSAGCYKETDVSTSDLVVADADLDAAESEPTVDASTEAADATAVDASAEQADSTAVDPSTEEADAAPVDASAASVDATAADASTGEAALADAGPAPGDATAADAGPTDAHFPDAAPLEDVPTDAASPDAGFADAADPIEAGVTDAALTDAELSDATSTDADIGDAALASHIRGTPQLLSTDFQLAEGPLWDPCAGHLLFTDVEASRVYAVDAEDNIEVVLNDTNYANGLAFDPEGRLVLAQMGGGQGGRIVRVERDGQRTVLADAAPGGGLLNTSDDLIIRSDGTLYFTDPVVAHGPYLGFSFGPNPIYRVAPTTGEVTQEASGSLPNGVDLSPDEKTLYVAVYLAGQVWKFAVGEDGELSGKEVFLKGLRNPDSMCLDVAGNLYIGVREGLLIARPDGSVLGTLALDTTKGVTNCAFGGEDGTTLYVTAWTSLWKIEGAAVKGLDWETNRNIECDP